VVPVCLVLIGLSLEHWIARAVAFGIGVSALKLVLMPLVVVAVAHWGFGLGGQALSVSS
jgi:predicted permease